MWALCLDLWPSAILYNAARDRPCRELPLTLDRSLASCPIHEQFGQLALDNRDLHLERWRLQGLSKGE
ncbi:MULTISPECIES: hypothetical protein [Cyanophyceae]|uniref:hypothetical protein n=1 Tax=Cyanophyceae TaxID=3028117 RepID=UPI0016871658|nr:MULTISPECIES: hypothetical protein [Cyanophyceae]MBD1918286.1 hypothetical protein [Phormidium sp. FACHB-77]MBD2031330.1 hypothetical protein [Phormidium sp. FACHB-322]MBD2052397.1 hypothetical protein [Leptolyngbya sp. FACHB-60]